MRTLCMLLALCVTSTMTTASVAAAETDATQQATQDPNFRWHKGRWWYWQAPQQRWLVWDGTQWQNYEPRRTVRSYSYMQDDFSSPRVNARSRSGGRISNSFGIRDAGSKIRGEY